MSKNYNTVKSKKKKKYRKTQTSVCQDSNPPIILYLHALVHSYYGLDDNDSLRVQRPHATRHD